LPIRSASAISVTEVYTPPSSNFCHRHADEQSPPSALPALPEDRQCKAVMGR
jgi:hypothetical protein